MVNGVFATPRPPSEMRIRRSTCLLLLACLAIIMGRSRAIICFRCTVLPPQYKGDANQTCSQFDESPRFYHDCPTSTFCMKRITHYKLPNGTTVTTAERDCAHQKYEYQQYNYENRQWNTQQGVDTEIYTKGCFKGENRGTPNGPSEYCYCAADYCNASSLMGKPLAYVSLLVVAAILRLS